MGKNERVASLSPTIGNTVNVFVLRLAVLDASHGCDRGTVAKNEL